MKRNINSADHVPSLWPVFKVLYFSLGLPQGLSGKESASQCRRRRRPGLDPWVGKVPWRGNGSPLQYPCLESPMDRGAWRAAAKRVAKGRT